MQTNKKRKSLEKLSPADYSKLLALYLDEKKQKQALKMAADNISALEMLVQFETMVAMNKRLEIGSVPADYKLPVYQIVEIAEKFFHVEDPKLIETELKGNKIWQTIKASAADFGLFQDTLAFLFTWGDRPMIPTPAYLKQIVMNRIYMPRHRQKKSRQLLFGSKTVFALSRAIFVISITSATATKWLRCVHRAMVQSPRTRRRRVRCSS
ncbi:hypothetical protein [Turneriella parva]|uniref:hypothetical protein n=1 Tax=Turneriella parva TaxID=29510 RepID=UPI000300A6B5|nr:hypothetical protein [Turneriella parva]